MTFDFATFMRQRALRLSPAVNTPVKKWISLRNGKQTLDFMGELVATITERNAVHSGASEWKLSIYRALEGKYVFASELKLTSPERMTLYSARFFDTEHELRTFLLEEQHMHVDLPRQLLQKAGMLQPRHTATGSTRLQWGDGWASVWQLLAQGGFNYAESTTVPQ